MSQVTPQANTPKKPRQMILHMLQRRVRTTQVWSTMAYTLVMMAQNLCYGLGFPCSPRQCDMISGHIRVMIEPLAKGPIHGLGRIS